MRRSAAPSSRAKRARSSISSKKQQVSSSAVAKYGIPRSVKVFGKSPFPDTLSNTVRYCDIKPITFTAGFAAARFRANSMFDPDLDVGGHQPRYFDELMGIYNHYRVIKSRIKVQTTSPNVGVFGGYISIVLDDDGTLAYSNSFTPLEQPDQVNVSWPDNGDVVTLWKNYDAVKKFGRGTMSNPDLTGNSSSDVTEQMVYHIMCYNSGLASGSAYLKIEIEYDCVWDELKTTVAS